MGLKIKSMKAMTKHIWDLNWHGLFSTWPKPSIRSDPGPHSIILNRSSGFALLISTARARSGKSFQISGCQPVVEHPMLKIPLLVSCTNRRYFVLLPVMPLLYCVMYTQYGWRVTTFEIILAIWLHICIYEWSEHWNSLPALWRMLGFVQSHWSHLSSFFHHWLNF